MNDPRLDIALDTLSKISQQKRKLFPIMFTESAILAQGALSKIKTMRGKPCAGCAKKKKLKK